jgi:hypothetical protein
MKVKALSDKWTRWLVIALLCGIGTSLVACAPRPEAATPCPEASCPECPEPLVTEVPYAAPWAASAHADAASESFTHWDEEIPMKVPVSCAKCHSTPGYLDFVGADGTAAGTVEEPAEIGTTITCVACHNEATAAMDGVVFPSGIEVTGLGGEARCVQCHQGRACTASVDEAIAAAGLPDDDTASGELAFVNVHYAAAAATQYGGIAMGGYQYPARAYDVAFAHVKGHDSCTSCHDAHSLEVQTASCAGCHEDVLGAENLRSVRLEGAGVDYDGDGDVSEGIQDEITGLQEALYGALRSYARTPIVYDAHIYPYFFIDTNMDGVADGDEASYPNKYDAWTGRLLKAAYNYQFVAQDPGAYAHNPRYTLQILYDSLADIEGDTDGMARPQVPAK